MIRATTAVAAMLIPTYAAGQVCGWTPLSQTGSPSGQFHPGLVYDDSNQRMVLYRGAGTWSWDGSAWSQIPTSTDPPARSTRAIDAQPCDTTQKILLYGGENPSANPPFFNDTWTFDGTDWTQHAVVGPPGGSDGALAYHAAIGRFVHFGGRDLPCCQNVNADTYEWDGVQWNAVFAPGPSARHGHMMAYDPLRQQIVLFGGLAPGFGNQSDTWVYDAAGWTQRLVSGPPPLRSAAMAFDPSRGTIVLHGGRLDSASPNNQTWEWNGTAWSLVSEISPVAREFHGMAYDPANAQLLIISGGASEFRWMNWSTGPTIAPVTGTATADYPCPLSLGIVATGGPALTYQWFKDGAPIANGGPMTGATSDTLAINPTSALTADAYFCRVTDSCGTQDSGTILVGARCLADVNMNGTAEPGDFNAWILAYNSADSSADQNCDGLLTPADFNAWVLNYNAGC